MIKGAIFRMIKISPSILSADFSRLGEEAAAAEAAGADLLHLDVMDGHFVPNLTFGAPVIASLRSRTSLPFDVHLMIDNPLDTLDAYLAAGADILTFHLEAVSDPRPLITRIRDAGAAPCIAIKPGTPVQAVFPYLESLSMVLVMTVEPGFGGQTLIRDCLNKAAALRHEAVRRGIEPDIQADGGLNPTTIGEAAAAGINVFVAGSAVFQSADRAASIRTLRENARKSVKPFDGFQ